MLLKEGINHPEQLDIALPKRFLLDENSRQIRRVSISWRNDEIQIAWS
jgi:hypothetical protein